MANVGAKASSKLVLLLVCLFAFMFISHSSHGQELELLLSFKASIDDPLHSLSNWVDYSDNFNICTWYGINCDNSSHVNSIELSGKNITARKISLSIFNLLYVRKIDLSNNQLAGQISLDSRSTSQLRFLNLSNNNFTGPLPNSLFSFSFSQLETLDLSNNMLSGKIPEQVGLLSNLKYLDFGGNVFTGKIPDTMTNMSSLQSLTLASNQLVGEIPRDIGVMKNLKWIYLGYNNLTGEIPHSIGELLSLNHLDLVYNDLTGKIPETLGNLSNLQYLFLYQNKLSGPLPRSIFELRKLVSLDVSYNSLSGEIPDFLIQLQSLEILHLFSNDFTGKIPKAVASLPRLQVLQLWSNRFIGDIPKELGKHSNLTVLDLSTNNFSGNIPDNLCNSGSLFKLILFSNSLQGDIPKSLSTCSSLRRVRLQNNRLSGPLSHELTKLPLVYFLDVSGNELSGKINDRKWDMPSIQMLNLANNTFYGELPESFGSDKIENMDLSDNRFSGKIPTNIGQLAELMQLNLSNNNLSGEDIPNELSSCKKLVSLDLSHNQLSGQLPESLAEMSVLGLLDLSGNVLSGGIPQNLGKVKSLVQVNVSHNHFQGRLPSTGAFLAINLSAITGNNLCDETGDSANGLPSCKRVNNPTWWFILTCFLVALAAIFLASFLIVNVRRRKELELRRVETEDKIWELQFLDLKAAKSISVIDILSSRKVENVICRGKNEVSYKGKCIINGMQFVVTEIMNDSNSVVVSFWPEIAEFGKLTRHRNIVNLMGICRSGKDGYLVYEYCNEKNLSDIVGSLSWVRRRQVILGIAKALRFLHNQCSPIVVVGEMSPDRVVVDEKYEPHLKLRPPGMFSTDSKCFISSGYVAPECSPVVSAEAKNPKDMTQKSEIYGFGLILIELLTGKKPTDMEFGLHENIVEWARYCYSDCHINMWMDPMIRGHVSNDEIVEIMNLAINCTSGDPTARPNAVDLLKTLQPITRAGLCHT